MAGATRAATSEMEPPSTTTVPGRSTLSNVRELPALQAFAVAFPGSGSPSESKGPCPFSQKVLIALEERRLPYVATYIDESIERPKWFLDKNSSGLLPVLRDGETWIQDSEAIIDHLCSKYVEESEPFKTPQNIKERAKQMIQKQFGSLNDWLKSKNKDDPAGKAYEHALQEVNEHLKKNGPYMAGDKPTDIDFDFAPKLRHARTLLLHFMDFIIPTELTSVLQYIDLTENRPSFKRTDSPDNDIIFSWQKKLSLPERVPLMQSS